MGPLWRPLVKPELVMGVGSSVCPTLRNKSLGGPPSINTHGVRNYLSPFL